MNDNIKTKTLAFVEDLTAMIRKEVLGEMISRLEGAVGGSVPKTKRRKKAPKDSAVSAKPGRKTKLDTLTKAQRGVYDALKATGKPMPTADIAKAINVSVSTTLYHLTKLEKLRVIKRMKEGHAHYFQLR